MKQVLFTIITLQATLLAKPRLDCPLIANEIVTNPLRADGFGAQFQTIIYSIIYAELNYKTFTYTPFKAMEHNYENDEAFLEKKEWLVNLIGHFPINEDVNTQCKISARQ